MAVRLSGLRVGRPLPQEDSWYAAEVRLEELGQMKKSTSSGLEHATLYHSASTN
jgi:hypothetical protein